MSDAQKKRASRQDKTKKDLGPKGKGTPKTVGSSRQKSGSMFFI